MPNFINATKMIKLCAVAVAALGFGVFQIQAQSVQTLYDTPGSPAWRDNYSGGSGCIFTVGGSNVVVSHLGYFCSNSITGLNTNHYVGIYSASPVQLLAQVIVPAGVAADAYTNEFYWMPLDPPFLLQSNTTYYVAALPYNGDGDLWGDTFPATFNPFFLGDATNDLNTAPETAYGPGTTAWPITGFSNFGTNNANTTYCVEGMANLPIDQARVGVQGTNINAGPGPLAVVGFASGQPPINYQWWLAGSPATLVSGQTNANLTFANAAPGDSGTYFLTASNALGGEQSPNVTVTISSEPAGISVQPANATAYNNYPATFSVVVTGSPPISVQWYSNSVAIPGSAATDQNAFVFTNSYSLIAQTLNNGAVYSLVASNTVAATAYTATSAVATLTVVPNFAYPQHILHGPPSTNVFYENNQNGMSGDVGPNPTGSAGGDIVIGNNPVLITHLGYDAVGLALNGFTALQDSHHISLYDSSGNLLGYVIITNGTPVSSAIDGYLWAPLNPPLLLSNNTTYVVAAEEFYEADPWGTTYVPTNWDTFITPGGSVDNAVYVNSAWPAEPASGHYGSQIYSSPNMGNLVLSNEIFSVIAPSRATQAAGTTATLTGYVDGPPPVTVQWYQNGAPLPGQTNITLTLPNLSSANAGNYTLVAMNPQLSLEATSAVATVVVYSSPVIITALPETYTNLANTNIMTLYAGANPDFSMQVLGYAPLAYQWYTNGVAVGLATNTTYQANNLQPGGITNFMCIVTNADGSATNAWAATILQDPTNSAGGPALYPQSVLSLKPIGYWRLNEPGNNSYGNPAGANDGLVCHDYAGGNDGIYTNLFLSEPGYNPANDPSDTSAQFGEANENNDFGDSDANSIAGINFAAPTGKSVAFTVEAWVAGYPAPTYDAGIVTLGWGGGGEQFDLDEGSDTAPASHAFRFFIRDASGVTHGVSSLLEPAGITTWYHLAAVVDEISNQTVSFYTNGVLCGAASLPSGSGILTATNGALGELSLMSIGARMSAETANFNDQFYGNINDVAIYNFALSSNQILNQYLLGGQVPPYFSPAPITSITAVANAPMVIPVTVDGAPPLGYQWIDTRTSDVLASGVTNGTVLNAGFLTNTAPASFNNDTLELVVTNAFGTTNLMVATTVTYSPEIVTDLPPQIVVGQGQSYTYGVGAVGETNLIYQWYENTVPIFGATNAAYSPSTAAGGTNSVFVVVTNNYGSVTSSISAFIVIPLPNTPLAGAITALHPIAYWPMHEVEPAAQGDIETNYGTLGALATGYYSDWYANYGAFTHGYQGAIAGDSGHTSVFFNCPNSNGGGPTNALYVSHASPLSTLRPPFSVECWIYKTITANQGDVWSQNGFEGENAGSLGNGQGTVGGIRLYDGGSAFTIYCYNNSSGLNGPISMPGGTISANQWYDVVLTCDAGTNMTLYTNGVAYATKSAVGLFTPDYWTPFEVGSGRGDTRSLSEAAVDDVSVYTNALSAATVLNHYQTGINPTPSTSYFNTVLGDHPTIYLRMDSPAYNPTPQSTWPTLYNYGSVLLNGVYNPGTIPGIVPGPSANYGTYSASGAGTNVALLSGVSGWADAGYAPQFDPSAKYGTGSNAFSVVAMFRGNPADNRYQCMVGHSDGSWRVALGANAAGGGAQGSVQFAYGSQVSSTVTCNDGNWHQVVGVYSPGAAASPGTVTLYVDGRLNNTATSVSSNGITTGSALDVYLGAAPDYATNGYSANTGGNPAGLGRQFNGQLCDVALFTNALTPDQVLALYNAAGGAQQALSMPITGELPVTWNYLGSNLGNNMGPTNLLTLYSGASPSFSVNVSGVPVSYQWYTNGVGVGFGTNSILSLPNVQIGSFNAYCIATNNISSVTSVVWSAQVVADPDPAGSFSQTVMSDNPMAYWRLNESAGSTVALDYAGGANGLYGSLTTNGLPGVPIAGAASELGVAMNPNTGTMAQETVTNAGIVLNTNNITFVCWVLPTALEQNPSGLFENRSTAGSSGYQLGSSGASGPGGTNFVDYNWGGSASAYNYGDPFGIPTNQWGMAVCEITPQNAQFYVYYGTNGLVGIATNSFNSQIESFFGGNEIGADPNGGSGPNHRILNGEMNELAIFNYQLSMAQINALYQSATNGALGAPSITAQPAGASVVLGSRTNFTVGAASFLPLTYQWYYNSANTYAGATQLANNATFSGVTTPVLGASGLAPGNSGYYFVAVSNSSGTQNSAIAQLSVGPAANPTNIVFSVSGGTNLMLSWPSDHVGWQLQAQTNKLSVGISSNWVNVGGSIGTNQIVIPINLTNGCVFFRLIYP